MLVEGYKLIAVRGTNSRDLRYSMGTIVNNIASCARKLRSE